MKKIILSADGDYMLYLVPDDVADHLEDYCAEFDRWLWESPEAEGYRRHDAFGSSWVSFVESDFIAWLNTHHFPQEPAVALENLGSSLEPLPEEYADLLYFNF